LANIIGINSLNGGKNLIHGIV